MMERRQTPFVADQEKFSTQRTVTYVLLTIFAATSAFVLYDNDQSERSMVLQTIINLTLLAVGYWLGASKQGQDASASQSRIAEAAPAVAAAVVANAAPAGKADTVQVTGDTVNVTKEEKP